MFSRLWLRAEESQAERRAPLTPQDVEVLIENGTEVTVEKSAHRIFSSRAYAKVGAKLASAGEWRTAPRETVILGLKELPRESTPLHHTHVYFGHAFKGQPDGELLLRRFAEGGGQLLDLEYLVDARGERLAAMGYWAGFVGAALGVLSWVLRRRGKVLPPLESFASSDQLLRRLLVEPNLPDLLVIGARGRCGAGAVDLVRALGLSHELWGREETQRPETTSRLLEFGVAVNCVENAEPRVPLLTPEALAGKRRLSVLSDVTCDVGNPCNLFPLSDTGTTVEQPVREVAPGFDLIAIDRLPALLPFEASRDFSAQLLPLLLGAKEVWERARRTFEDHLRTRITTPAAASTVNATRRRSVFSPRK